MIVARHGFSAVLNHGPTDQVVEAIYDDAGQCTEPHQTQQQLDDGLLFQRHQRDRNDDDAKQEQTEPVSVGASFALREQHVMEVFLFALLKCAKIERYVDAPGNSGV